MIWASLILAGLDALLVWALYRPAARRELSLAVAGVLSAAFLGLFALLRFGFVLFELTLEQDGTLIFAVAMTALAAGGFVAARRCQRIPGRELMLALLVVLEAALVLALLSGARGGLSTPAFRALLIAPAALPLAGYFGASLGYLASGRAATFASGYETLIARRFLLSKASPVLSTVTTISLVGVAIGVWLVILSLAVLSGFEFDLKGKIIGANAPLALQQPSGAPFVLDRADAEVVAAARDVVAQGSVVEGEAAIASSSNYSGAMVFGIDPARAARVLPVLTQVVRGSMEPIARELYEAKDERPSAARAGFSAPRPLASIAIGIEMAKGLHVGVGDRVRLISPNLETITPLGPVPKSVTFEVAAVFQSKMYEYDARYAYVSLPAARRFFELGADEVTSLLVAVRDPDHADVVSGRITKALAGRYVGLDWKGRNQTLFSALKLERVVAFVVLVFIILVASFAIVNTLTMSVIEKKKDIAILKTMGAHDRGIMRLFLSQGLIIGVCGTTLGTLAALFTVFLLERFGFAIPGDVYYIDSLPVHLSVFDVVAVLLAALLIVWDFAVFPALSGARLAPVEGLRDG